MCFSILDLFVHLHCYLERLSLLEQQHLSLVLSIPIRSIEAQERTFFVIFLKLGFALFFD